MHVTTDREGKWRIAWFPRMLPRVSDLTTAQRVCEGYVALKVLEKKYARERDAMES